MNQKDFKHTESKPYSWKLRDLKTGIKRAEIEIRRYQENIEVLNKSTKEDSKIEMNEMKDWLEDK